MGRTCADVGKCISYNIYNEGDSEYWVPERLEGRGGGSGFVGRGRWVNPEYSSFPNKNFTSRSRYRRYDISYIQN